MESATATASVPVPTDATWTRAARLLAPPNRPRCRIHDGDSYAREGDIPDHVPGSAVAVYLADERGSYWTLGFDFDAKRGDSSDDATRDAARFVDDVLRPANVSCFAVPSGGGGWHVWVPMGRPMPADSVRELANAAAAMFPTLDPMPLSNPKTGCLRPPGTLHRDGWMWSGWVEPDTIDAVRSHNAFTEHGHANAWARLCSAFVVDDGYRRGGQVPPNLLTVLTGADGQQDRSVSVARAVAIAKAEGWELERLRDLVERIPGPVADRIEEEHERGRDYLRDRWPHIHPATGGQAADPDSVPAAVAAWFAKAQQLAPDSGKLRDAIGAVALWATRGGYIDRRMGAVVFTMVDRDAGAAMSVTGNTARKYVEQVCQLGALQRETRDRGTRYRIPLSAVCDEIEQYLTGGGSPNEKTLLKNVTKSDADNLSGISNPTVARRGDGWRRLLAVLANDSGMGTHYRELAAAANVSPDSARRWLSEWARSDARYPFAIRVHRGYYMAAPNLSDELRDAPHNDGAHERNTRRRVRYVQDAYAYHVAGPVSSSTSPEPVVVMVCDVPPWATSSPLSKPRRVGQLTMRHATSSAGAPAWQVSATYTTPPNDPDPPPGTWNATHTGTVTT